MKSVCARIQLLSNSLREYLLAKPQSLALQGLRWQQDAALYAERLCKRPCSQLLWTNHAQGAPVCLKPCLCSCLVCLCTAGTADKSHKYMHKLTLLVITHRSWRNSSTGRSVIPRSVKGSWRGKSKTIAPAKPGIRMHGTRDNAMCHGHARESRFLAMQLFLNCRCKRSRGLSGGLCLAEFLAPSRPTLGARHGASISLSLTVPRAGLAMGLGQSSGGVHAVGH